MSIKLVDKEEFALNRPLCESCGNAVPQLCAFVRDKKPEIALDAMCAKAVKIKFFRGQHCEVAYRVIACPAYKPGSLPVIPEVKHKPEPVSLPSRYDASCPVCGSANNVKVAGGEFLESPRDWFCRCYSCNKSFHPRKKEDAKKMSAFKTVEQDSNLSEETLKLNEGADVEPNNTQDPAVQEEPPKTRRERIRELITKEQYVALKEQGLSNTEVMNRHNIPLGWTDVLISIRRKEWGITEEIKPVSPLPDAAEQKQASTASRLTIAQAIELRRDMEEDIEELNLILEQEGNKICSPRIIGLLTSYRDEYQRTFDRIGEVFNKTDVAI